MLKAYRTLWNGQTDPKIKFGLPDQARWHGVYCGGTAAIGDVHSNWFFLPWHRAFVYFHEQVLGSIIDDPDFRLPYWDWETGNSVMPQFFEELGIPSFLSTANHCPRQPNQLDTFKIDNCMLQAWLWSQNFQDFCGSSTPRPQGRAQGGPHGVVHQYIVGGAMSVSTTAAADPIFFAHHANVDRYWAYWMNKYTGDAYKPPQAGWSDVPLYFRDKDGRLICVTPQQLVQESSLNYCYEDSVSSLPNLDLQTSALQGVLHDATKFYRAILSVLTRTLIDRKMISLSDAIAALSNHDHILEVLKKYYISLPAQLRFSVPTTNLKPGSFYLVQLSRGSQSTTIGGFGVFDQHMSMSDEATEIAFAGCIGPAVLDVLFKGRGPIVLKWGASAPGGVDSLEITRGTITQIQISNFAVLCSATIDEIKKNFDPHLEQIHLPLFHR